MCPSGTGGVPSGWWLVALRGGGVAFGPFPPAHPTRSVERLDPPRGSAPDPGGDSVPRTPAGRHSHTAQMKKPPRRLLRAGKRLSGCPDGGSDPPTRTDGRSGPQSALTREAASRPVQRGEAARRVS
ncbi:hypothetical protein TPA0905_51560 [Streptomyces olivaceus]|nr:hypothetical protein TPA0905_51560 [Streptomyces olivaceus]